MANTMPLQKLFKNITVKQLALSVTIKVGRPKNLNSFSREKMTSLTDVE